jgi:tetratricopeptide (TPR) repeat protein
MGRVRSRLRRIGWLAGLSVLAGTAVVLGGPHARAWYHLRAGRSALERYHAAEARAHLAKCLAVWPRSPEARLLAGRAARLAGDYESAREQLHQAQHAQGGPSPAITLEWALLRASAGDLPDVEPYLQHTAESRPPLAPLVWEALAQGYTRMCRLPDALTCLNRWLETQPDNPQALFLRGNLYRQAQAPQKAVPDYRRALELDPARDDARWQLVLSLLDVGAYDEAVGHLEEARKRSPDDPGVLVRLARCHAMLGRTRKARQLLDAVLEEHPDDGLALRTRGDLDLRAGRADDAERWLRRAATRMPNDYLTHLRLKEALRAQGKDDEARRAGARADRLKQQQERLTELITRKLAERPNDPDLHAELGALLIEMGRKEQGEGWLATARTLHARLAERYEREGDAARAEYHRRQAEADRPGPQ